jgi:hypothetical protein
MEMLRGLPKKQPINYYDIKPRLGPSQPDFRTKLDRNLDKSLKLNKQMSNTSLNAVSVASQASKKPMQ